VRRGRVISALIVACGLQSACAGPASEADGAAETWAVTPLAWRAFGPQANDGELLLLGSIHLGRSGVHDFGPGIARAYEKCDELVVEVDLSTITPETIAAVSARYVMLPKGQSLSDLVSRETYAQLESYFAGRGATVASFEGLKPWAVSTAVALMEFQAAGMREDHGIDRHFIAAAVSERRPIRALETVQSQLEVLDGLSPRSQELLLEDALERVGDDPADLVTAWEQGDEEWLKRLLLGPLDENPEFAEFYEALFFRRNAAMAAKLEGLVGDGKRRFVVVGAAHMLGDRGIPALLAARGFRVERLADRSEIRPLKSVLARER
jgi:uncharacterized protein YbaP (TraB family)